MAKHVDFGEGRADMCSGCFPTLRGVQPGASLCPNNNEILQDDAGGGLNVHTEGAHVQSPMKTLIFVLFS